ncbi:MAG: riboflavin biosynthesis protein RibF [Planctomycetes bacterium]|nr:riboflavin biosynthesis protein RibF [Planctomycetota bacterium]
MKVFNNFRAARALKRPVLTWGVFDGVHRGHRELIDSVLRWARRMGSDSLVITFNNHPARVLNLHDDPLFITSLAHRLLLLEKLGVGATLVLNFTRKLSRLTAEDFVNKMIKALKPAGVVMTDNISFGRNRAGNIRTLKEILDRHNIPLKIIKTLKYKNRIISSSLIRRAIKEGDLVTAQKMLDRPVAILGTVVHGAGRGRKLGFPTANLDPHHEILPRRGVYIARAVCMKGCKFSAPFKALVNVGIKPTFSKSTGHPEEDIEVFLLNYDVRKHGSLYGRDVLVEIIAYLRDERRFPSPQALINQIRKDLVIARK